MNQNHVIVATVPPGGTLIQEGDQILCTIFPSGEAEVAVRSKSGFRWSPPIPITENTRYGHPPVGQNRIDL